MFKLKMNNNRVFLNKILAIDELWKYLVRLLYCPVKVYKNIASTIRIVFSLYKKIFLLNRKLTNSHDEYIKNTSVDINKTLL